MGNEGKKKNERWGEGKNVGREIIYTFWIIYFSCFSFNKAPEEEEMGGMNPQYGHSQLL